MKICREDKSNFKEFIFDNSLSMYKKIPILNYDEPGLFDGFGL
jgi:hypothetical protein